MTEHLLALKQRLGAVRLIPSGGGAFEVSVNGKRIFSKLETGSFPEPEAILKSIKPLL